MAQPSVQGRFIWEGLVAEDAAVIRANDHGLVVGDGVFETCKVVDGEVFALGRHLRRLGTSATGLGLHNRVLDQAVAVAGGGALLVYPYARRRDLRFHIANHEVRDADVDDGRDPDPGRERCDQGR